MSATTRQPIDLNEEEFALLGELLETEQARLLVGIRHSFHRDYRNELLSRIDLVEKLLQRIAGGGREPGGQE